ncbi:MAG: response regulator transcription factor [Dehalococcoidales bacterium]|nr:response regulator transcription factor [Dehalococcoidales bacterium]
MMKILLIEDSPEIVKGVTLTFKLRWPDAAVICAENGKKGLELVENEPPDIVILDINLPDISGFEVLENMRKYSNVPTIILTVRDDEVDELRGFELGADDYILKPFSPSNLLIRCKAVLRRSGIRSQEETQMAPIESGNIYINFSKREVKVNNEDVHLTPNESHILYCLARNEGKIIPQDVIKQQVWGNEAKYIDNSALKRYIYQLRLKLGDSAEDPKIILNERGVGYRFVRAS